MSELVPSVGLLNGKEKKPNKPTTRQQLKEAKF